LLPPGSLWPAPSLRPLAAALLLVAVLPARQAHSQCVESPPASGDFTCSGIVAGGFAGVGDNLDVTVESGATLQDGGGTVDAIRINNTSTVTVEVGASVEATASGLDGITGGDDNTISNAGGISITGDNAAGIRMGNGAAVTNEVGGVISILNDDGVGIAIGNGGTIVNRGNINGMADRTVGISLGDGTMPFNSMPPDPDFEEPLNQRTVAVSGDAVIGIRAGSNNVFENRGTISATSDSGMGQTTPIGVWLTGGTNEFTNSGGVTASGDDAVAVRSDAANEIFNEGTLTATGMNALAILGSVGVETVENFGRINGSVDLGGGNDILRLNTGSSIDATMDLIIDGGAGTNALMLMGDGLGFLDLGPTADRPNAPTVTNFDSLTIGPTPDDDGLWGLSGSATLPGGMAVMNGASISLGSTVSIAGPVTLDDDSTLIVTVNPGGSNGRLSSTGTVTIGNDTTLGVAFTAPLLADTTLTVLGGAGFAGFGSFANTPADTALLDFELNQTATEIQLSILRASYASVADTPNQGAVGAYLDRVIQGSPSPDVEAALVQLDLFTAEELRAAYDALHPEAYDAQTGAMARLGQVVASAAVRPRLWCKPPLSELRPGRYQDEPCGRKGFSVFMEAITQVHDRDTGSDWLTSDGNTQGILGGVDWLPDPHFLVSGWAGLASIDVDVDGVGDGDIDTIELGISGTARRAGARVRAALGYGRGDHQQDRTIAFGGVVRVAAGEFNSNRVTGLVELGYVIEQGGLRIEPLAELDVVYLMEDAFEEEGASGLNLVVDERSNTLVSTGFGARLSYRHVQRAYVDPGPGWSQGVWTPEISGRWRSTWTFADREIDAAFQGVPDAVGGFTTEAQDTEQGAEVGARLTFQPHGSGGSFSLGYEGYFGDGGMQHRAGAQLRIHF